MECRWTSWVLIWSRIVWARSCGRVAEVKPAVIYLNSFFDPRFSLPVLALKLLIGASVPPVICAPRGERRQSNGAEELVQADISLPSSFLDFRPRLPCMPPLTRRRESYVKGCLKNQRFLWQRTSSPEVQWQHVRCL